MSELKQAYAKLVQMALTNGSTNIEEAIQYIYSLNIAFKNDTAFQMLFPTIFEMEIIKHKQACSADDAGRCSRCRSWNYSTK